MKKMTDKEFKQILEDAGMSFEVLGYEGVLNEISGRYRELANEFESRGCASVALKFRETADNIYNALDARGFYDDCKMPDLTD